MIIEDRIEYNDLVNSIQDDDRSYEDKSDDAATSASNDVESNKGNFLIVSNYYFSLVYLLMKSLETKVIPWKVDDKS